MSRGKFITFEGGEGSGKTTQSKKLSDHLDTLNIPHILTKQPGGSNLGQELRRILLQDNDFNISPEQELLLFVADRINHLENVVLPALKEGKHVICDRYVDSTLAYQCYGRGVEIKKARQLHANFVPKLDPDITLLFNISVEGGLARTEQRATHTSNKTEAKEMRFEKAGLDFHRKMHDGFLELARQHSERFEILDARQSIEEVHQEVLSHVLPLLTIES